MCPVSLAAFIIASLSRGLIVFIFNTLHLIPNSLSSSDASIAGFTVSPVAIIVISFPSLITLALPI